MPGMKQLIVHHHLKLFKLKMDSLDDELIVEEAFDQQMDLKKVGFMISILIECSFNFKWWWINIWIRICWTSILWIYTFNFFKSSFLFWIFQWWINILWMLSLGLWMLGLPSLPGLSKPNINLSLAFISA